MAARQLLTNDFNSFIRNMDVLADNLQSAIDAMAAGNVSANLVIGIYTDLNALINQATRLRNQPGITAHARNELQDAAYDFIASATTFVGACQQASDWVEANFPKDANGWLNIVKLVNGSVETRGFDSSQTTAFRGILLNVINLRP